MKYRKPIILVVAILFGSLFFAHYAENKEAVCVPRDITLSWADDPATTQSICWRSNVRVDNPQVQLALWDAEPRFGKNARMFSCETESFSEANEDETSTFYYSVTLRDLIPDTVYGYRVGDGNTWSEWHRFRTAKKEAASFRFIYLGDVQNDILSLGSRSIREAYAACPDARFVAFAGDLVAEGYDASLWGEFSQALGFIGATVPALAAPGNHDSHLPDTEEVRGPHRLFTARFVFPTNGPEGVPALKEASYYMDYQNVRLIVLDSNVFANGDYATDIREKAWAAQIGWLKRILSENPCRWTIVVQHHPVFSVGKDRDNAEMREALMPIFQDANVDLVLQGHDHHYGRTHKIRDGQIVAPEAAGVIYVTSVAGPKMYAKNPKFEHLMAVMRGDTQMYQVVEISNDDLWFRAYAVGGELVDSFCLHKNADGTTKLQ